MSKKEIINQTRLNNAIIKLLDATQDNDLPRIFVGLNTTELSDSGMGFFMAGQQDKLLALLFMAFAQIVIKNPGEEKLYKMLGHHLIDHCIELAQGKYRAEKEDEDSDSSKEEDITETLKCFFEGMKDSSDEDDD